LYFSALGATSNGVTKPTSPPWSTFRSSLLLTLADFDGALRGANPEVPPAVAAQLTIVQRNVGAGETALGAAPGYSEYTHATSGDVLAGYAALSRAGELVGNACAFSLAPSPYSSTG